MRTNLEIFAKYSELDWLQWRKDADNIEENLYDLTDQDDFVYSHDAIAEKLRWAWNLRRQAIAYSRYRKERDSANRDS